MASNLSNRGQIEEPFQKFLNGAPPLLSLFLYANYSFFYFIENILPNFFKMVRSSRTITLKYNSPCVKFIFLIASRILITQVENCVLKLLAYKPFLILLLKKLIYFTNFSLTYF